jgi:hypothetical protein
MQTRNDYLGISRVTTQCRDDFKTCALLSANIQKIAHPCQFFIGQIIFAGGINIGYTFGYSRV